MFRDMRRRRQQLSAGECERILQRMTAGILAVNGDDGYPYAVPVSYVYSDGKIYFHSALNGHKIDAIKRDSRVSFCVVEQDMVVPEKYTTYFRSVIVFGKAHIIEDKEQKMSALELLAEKYAPGEREIRPREIESGFSRLHMVEIDLEHVTGKEAIELVGK